MRSLILDVVERMLLESRHAVVRQLGILFAQGRR